MMNLRAMMMLLFFIYVVVIVSVIYFHNYEAFSSNSSSPTKSSPQYPQTSLHPFQNHTYCFVHIGKSAGSTVSCELGFHYAPTCKLQHKTMRLSRENALVQHRGDMIHMESHNCHTNETNTVVLVSIRHPLRRLISWYFYERPDSIMYQYFNRPRLINRMSVVYQWFSDTIPSPENSSSNRDRTHERCGTLFFNDSSSTIHSGCFSTLDEFATSTCRYEYDDGCTSFCQKLAWDVAQGKYKCPFHNYYNYGYYASIINKTLSDLPIIIVRAEHLYHDLKTLSVMFGDDEVDASRQYPTTSKDALNGRGKTKDDEFLSKEGRRNLCRALCHEISVYEWFLNQARNLNEVEKAQSLRDSYELCPKEILHGYC